jgi:hypothetical protein
MPTAVTKTPPATGSLLEHAVVRLRRDFPERELKAGMIGAVVHVYADGTAYEVEFTSGSQALSLATLDRDDLEVVDRT